MTHEKGEPFAVGGPLDLAEGLVRLGGGNGAHVLAGRFDEHDVVLAVAIAEGDQRAVRRWDRGFGVALDLARRGGKDIDDPNAGFLAVLAGSNAAHDQSGSVPEPREARSTEAEARRKLERIGLAALQQTDVEAGRIGVGEMLAVGGNGGGMDRQLGGIGRELTLIQRLRHGSRRRLPQQND